MNIKPLFTSDFNKEFEELNAQIVGETTYKPQIKALSQKLLQQEEAQSRILQVYQTIAQVLPYNIYAAGMDTYEVLFVNQHLQDDFPGEQLVGKMCYTVFQGLDYPCSFCTNNKIRELHGKPYYWMFKNQLTKKWYWIVDAVIEWIDGRKVRFESAVDVSTPMEHSQTINGAFHGRFDPSAIA